jgi:tetratricopeptide (TPR) repeat protein
MRCVCVCVCVFSFRYGEAKRWLQYAIDTIKAIRGGTKNNDVAIVMTNLAIIFKEMGQMQEAVHFYEEALTIRRQLFRGQSPYIAQVSRHRHLACVPICL